MIRFPCPHCGAKLQVSEAHAGKKGRCPQCRGRTVVPQAPEAMPPIAVRKADPAPDVPRDPRDARLLDLPVVPVEPMPPPREAADEAASSEGSISGSRLGILLYPMNVSGVIHLVIFSLLPPLWMRASTLSFWMAPGIGPLCWLVVLSLYFLHYWATCLSDSAQGGIRAVDINSASMPLSVDALLSTGRTILPVVVLIWGPALAYCLLRGRVDWVLLLWLAAAGLTFPMVLLSVNYFDSVRGANPLLVLTSIASAPGPYAVLVACLSMLTALAALLMRLSPESRGGWVLRLLIIYILLTEAHLLGRFYRRNEQRLNWGT
jgi:DNA-directed RNA polymerase subunit RPC12/RpoP